MFYIAQVFGIIALIILVVSFQNNDKGKLLKYQIFSSLFFAAQYFCLGALTGALMNLMTLIRNVIYKRFKDKVSIIYIILIVVTMIGLSICSYNGVYSLLPAIAVILYSIALAQNNLTITRVVEAMSCSLFIIYNIKVLAISGLILTIIELIFVLIAIYRLDIRKNNKAMSK